MHFITFVSLAVLFQTTLAFPRFTQQDVEAVKRATCNDHQVARLFVLPDRPANTASKKIPDTAHPYRAPGPNDTRGPCPALNTLANHGYIDRSGVDTAENIIKAAMEGTNMERDFAAFATALAVLARGNANTATVSIGHPKSAVPPLPGCTDGLVAGGLATHGRFEGDCSITRLDEGQGNNADFNMGSFDKLLHYISLYGDDGPEGPKTLVNVKVMQELKYELFNHFQAADKEFSFEAGRQLTAFAETSFVLQLMQDGRTNRTSLAQLKHFFQGQTFGPDFHRRNGPAGIDILGPIAADVMSAHPVPYGHNDANGNYIMTGPSNPTFPCDGYTDLSVNQLPAVLNGQSGIFKQNVDSLVNLLGGVFESFAGCQQGTPNGPAGV